MTSYKIIWKCLSPYSTELQSDTIFGHIAWAVQYLFGSVKLSDFIAELKNKPSLVLSSAFPKNYLPLPFLPYPHKIRLQVKDWIINRKAYKNIKYIQRDILTAPDFCFDWIDFFNNCSLKGSENEPTVIKDIVFHNAIDRLSGTTSEGGNLFAAETVFVSEDYTLESYLQLESEIITSDMLAEIIEYISITGFGKDKSTGKGRFSISLEAFSFHELLEANAYMTLSNMIPAPTDPLQAFYQGFTKFGKLGGSFAGSETPYKFPLFIFQPGSVFSGGKPIGTVVEDIHPKSRELGIIQNLYAFSIPIKIKEPKDE